MNSSFTHLNNTNNNSNNSSSNMSTLHDDYTALNVPKFKSFSPPSLPFTPSPISPSSFLAFSSGFSPTHEFLNSPNLFLNSPNIFASPTSDAFSDQSFNWRNSYGEDQQQQQHNKEEDKSYPDFSFQTQTNPAPPSQFSSTMFQVEQQNKQDIWKFSEPKKQTDFTSERAPTKSEYTSTQNFSSEMQSNLNCTNAFQYARKQRKSEDGYNWRKYGQKQVKGSENPRSYYKCTHPNCSMRKKVERCLDGQITEIVYKGSHNHPKPQSNRRTSSQKMYQPSSSCTNSGISDQSVVTLLGNNPQIETVSLQEDSSASVEEEEFEQTSQTSYYEGNEVELGPDAKRLKEENGNEGYYASGNRTVREPRVVVQTTSEIDILDDGYRWRKYGQKVVKGNPNARSYYKCTAPGCAVRKHVERAVHDVKAVITTYEGKHNHDVPAARGSTGYRNPMNSNVLAAPAPIRPLAVTGYSNSSSFTNSLYKPTSGSQESFALDMQQSSKAKDDSFLQSFMSNN
ncbi:PREDICTED: probable WRKY transcription factor 33 isoform X2 [Lupinus angustifolius]|uniref:probable WRKY transcription factor 33 isoform X2 n=1 Tax=Lupinus angustifolius TaxID=3871 RepID=UPI00092FAE2E|nr:PREDICTED: probable WRKY transcription factor 33 isoform X2 [Lupinus angustifolius]